MAPTILDRMAVRGAAWIVFLGRLAIAALYVPSGFNKLVHLGSFADSMAARSVPVGASSALVAAGTGCADTDVHAAKAIAASNSSTALDTMLNIIAPARG